MYDTDYKKACHSYLNTVRFEADGFHRSDCPVCGGNNTFTARKSDGVILYNCYRASCGLSGAKDYELSVVDIRDQTARRLLAETDTTDKSGLTYAVPAHFLPVTADASVMRYLQANHCLDAVTYGAASLRYDPKLNRVVFLVQNEQGKVTDAVGRKLPGNTSVNTQKWWRYGSSNDVFVSRHLSDDNSTGPCDKLIVVEDAASACAVCRIADGMALLGTNLTASAKERIATYKQIILALDYDATHKAIEFCSILNWLCEDVRVVVLKDDLKYHNTEEIRSIING